MLLCVGQSFTVVKWFVYLLILKENATAYFDLVILTALESNLSFKFSEHGGN